MSVHIACGLRLGTNFCHPHECNCGTKWLIKSNGRHGLNCKQAWGQKMRHKEVNKLIKHGLDHTVSDWVPKKDSANFESDAFL